MEVKDIMIGDFVEYNSQTTKVIGISSDGFIDVTGEFENVAIGLVQPIPITPEILEKNGFQKEGDYQDIWYGKYYIVIKEGYNGYWLNVRYGRISTKINYVHELQHALKICGIDKEIEL